MATANKQTLFVCARVLVCMCVGKCVCLCIHKSQTDSEEKKLLTVEADFQETKFLN